MNTHPLNWTTTGMEVVAKDDGTGYMVAVTTPVLRAIVALARERGYNRRIDHLTDLDPDGTHILSPIPTNESLADDKLPPGFHSAAAEHPAPPHIRCAAWVKLRRVKEAEHATVDVPFEFWPRRMELVDARRRLAIAPHRVKP